MDMSGEGASHPASPMITYRPGRLLDVCFMGMDGWKNRPENLSGCFNVRALFEKANGIPTRETLIKSHNGR
jgi:hypothetical protein